MNPLLGIDFGGLGAGALGGALPFASGPEMLPAASDAAGLTSGADFAGMLTSGLERVQALQHREGSMAVQAATGELRDVHDYMIASSEAALATELTVAVRNKGLEAFAEIMRLQV